MGKHAAICYGYIEIDKDAWIAARTGGEVEECSERIADLIRTLGDELTHIPENPVAVFASVRAGSHWADDDFAVVRTAGQDQLVQLSSDLKIQRYRDPEYGPLAVIRTDGREIAYADSVHDATDWLTFDVEVFCDRGHGWLLRGGDLYDDTLTARSMRDVFGDQGMIRTTNDPRSERFGRAWITCPTCGEDCDVELREF